jgi:putative endonuclease
MPRSGENRTGALYALLMVRTPVPYWTYILRSKTTGRHYCGSTDNIERRVGQHNDPEYRGSKTTKRFEGPWEPIWKRESPTRAEAMSLEETIKKRGIARYLDDLETKTSS